MNKISYISRIWIKQAALYYVLHKQINNNSSANLAQAKNYNKIIHKRNIHPTLELGDSAL